jgi:hypothetical protein
MPKLAPPIDPPLLPPVEEVAQATLTRSHGRYLTQGK